MNVVTFYIILMCIFANDLQNAVYLFISDYGNNVKTKKQIWAIFLFK